jgi:hypothetical protein
MPTLATFICDCGKRLNVMTDSDKECKNFKAGGPAGMGPRGDVTVDVSCQLARGHTAARDGFKPRFPAGGGFKAVSSRGETHISPGV